MDACKPNAFSGTLQTAFYNAQSKSELELSGVCSPIKKAYLSQKNTFLGFFFLLAFCFFIDSDLHFCQVNLL